MRIVTLCLLVLASTTCLLTKVESNAVRSEGFEQVQPFEGFEQVQPFGDNGFIKTMKMIFTAILSTVQGVTCTMDEVANILYATSRYIEALENCTVDVPKDIAKIIKSCKKICSICNDILHLKSNICSHEDGESKTSFGCFTSLFGSVMSLLRNMNTVLHQMYNLPFDTEECYVTSTNLIIKQYESFVPNIQECCQK